MDLHFRSIKFCRRPACVHDINSFTVRRLCQSAYMVYFHISVVQKEMRTFKMKCKLSGVLMGYQIDDLLRVSLHTFKIRLQLSK